MAESIRITGVDTNLISDGYHTFGELYEHRIELWIALCKLLDKHDQDGCPVWRSELHSDGSRFAGWFVLGYRFVKGQQITYHLPISYWGRCSFAETLERAPDFDGHTSADVLARLGNV